MIYVLIESMMSAIGVLVMYVSPLSMCVHDITLLCYICNVVLSKPSDVYE